MSYACALMRRFKDLSCSLGLCSIFALGGSLLSGACTSDAPPSDRTAKVAADTTDTSDPAPAQVFEGPAKIASDEPVFDFGAIAGHEPIEHVFTIKNVGGEDLRIERVQKT